MRVFLATVSQEIESLLQFFNKKDFASAGTSVILPLDFERTLKQVVRNKGELPVREESK